MPTTRKKENNPPQDRSPTPFEIAALAVLIQIKDILGRNVQSATGNTGENSEYAVDCLRSAYFYLKTAESRSDDLAIEWARYQIFNQRPSAPRNLPPPRGEELIPFKDLLVIQKKEPQQHCWPRWKGDDLVRGSRIIGIRKKKPNLFGGEGFGGFTKEDLQNRPAGRTMVGCIGTTRGLNKAISRLFTENERSEIGTRRALTIEQIDRILIDQCKRYYEIPPVRSGKSSPHQ